MTICFSLHFIWWPNHALQSRVHNTRFWCPLVYSLCQLFLAALGNEARHMITSVRLSVRLLVTPLQLVVEPPHWHNLLGRAAGARSLFAPVRPSPNDPLSSGRVARLSAASLLSADKPCHTHFGWCRSTLSVDKIILKWRPTLSADSVGQYVIQTPWGV